MHLTLEEMEIRRQRLTHEPPMGSYEMLHNTALVKDGKVYLRSHGENDEDICLVEFFVKNICRKECGADVWDGEIPHPEDFDVADCGFSGCLYASFYEIAIGAADLRGTLKFYEDAEEQKKLIMLPLIPGQAVWTIETKADHKTKFIRERIVNHVSIAENDFMQFQLMDPRCYRDEPADYYFDDIFWQKEKIGQTIFTTLEDAELALAGRS